MVVVISWSSDCLAIHLVVDAQESASRLGGGYPKTESGTPAIGFGREKWNSICGCGARAVYA